MVRCVDDVGIVVQPRCLQRLDQARQLPVHEGHAGKVSPPLAPYLVLGEPVRLEMFAHFKGPGVVRRRLPGPILRKIATLGIKIPQFLRGVVGEMGMDDVDRKGPGPLQRRCGVRQPVNGGVDAFQVEPQVRLLYTELGSPFRGGPPDPERPATYFRIAGARLFPGEARLAESQLTARREDVRFAHVNGIHILLRQGAPVGGYIRLDADGAVGIGLNLMHPAPRHEGGPAGCAQGRRTVGAIVGDAIPGESIHSRRLDERMAVNRGIEGIVLVGDEQEGIGHIRFSASHFSARNDFSGTSSSSGR